MQGLFTKYKSTILFVLLLMMLICMMIIDYLTTGTDIILKKINDPMVYMIGFAAAIYHKEKRQLKHLQILPLKQSGKLKDRLRSMGIYLVAVILFYVTITVLIKQFSLLQCSRLIMLLTVSLSILMTVLPRCKYVTSYAIVTAAVFVFTIFLQTMYLDFPVVFVICILILIFTVYIMYRQCDFHYEYE